MKSLTVLQTWMGLDRAVSYALSQGLDIAPYKAVDGRRLPVDGLWSLKKDLLLVYAAQGYPVRLDVRDLKLRMQSSSGQHNALGGGEYAIEVESNFVHETDFVRAKANESGQGSYLYWELLAIEQGSSADVDAIRWWEIITCDEADVIQIKTDCLRCLLAKAESISQTHQRSEGHPASRLPAGLAAFNRDKSEVKRIAQIIARTLLSSDVKQDLRIGQLAELTYARLVEEGYQVCLPQSSEAVREWLKEVAPEYSRLPGRRGK